MHNLCTITSKLLPVTSLQLHLIHLASVHILAQHLQRNYALIPYTITSYNILRNASTSNALAPHHRSKHSKHLQAYTPHIPKFPNPKLAIVFPRQSMHNKQAHSRSLSKSPHGYSIPSLSPNLYLAYSTTMHSLYDEVSQNLNKCL